MAEGPDPDRPIPPGSAGSPTPPGDAAALARSAAFREESRRADLAFAGSVGATLFLCAVAFLILRQIFTLLFVSALLAYALLPLVDRLNRHGRLPRWLATALVTVGGVGVLALGVAAVAPSVASELARLPDAVRQAGEQAQEGYSRLHDRLPASVAHLLDQGVAAGRRAITRAAPGAEDLQGFATRAVAGAGGLAEALIFVPVLVFLILRGYHPFVRSAAAWVPPRWRPRFRKRAAEADAALSGFVRGQLLVALSLAVIYGVSFGLVGIPLGVVIGVLAGLCEMVPFLGGIVAVVLGTAMGLASGHPTKALWVIGIYFVVQGIQGAVGPWVVGTRAGISPLALILALAVGGELFGLLGLLAAAPVSAVLKVGWRALRAAYEAGPFFSRQPA